VENQGGAAGEWLQEEAAEKKKLKTGSIRPAGLFGRPKEKKLANEGGEKTLGVSPIADQKNG